MVSIIKETSIILKTHSKLWDNFWQLNVFWKWWKNAFCFTSKGLFVLQIFLVTYQKVNLMTSQPAYQTIVIHILPNISRNKGNQTMKFGQLIECKNILFFEEPCRKSGGETSSTPFSEKL